MTNNKLEQVYSDYINGNTTDLKAAIGKMTKRDMLDFIEYCAGFESRHLIINKMRLLLTK
jgi:hypothetical protein